MKQDNQEDFQLHSKTIIKIQFPCVLKPLDKKVNINNFKSIKEPALFIKGVRKIIKKEKQKNKTVKLLGILGMLLGTLGASLLMSQAVKHTLTRSDASR